MTIHSYRDNAELSRDLREEGEVKFRKTREREREREREGREAKVTFMSDVSGGPKTSTPFTIHLSHIETRPDEQHRTPPKLQTSRKKTIRRKKLHKARREERYK